MYKVAVVGNSPTARAVVAACHNSGFHDIEWVADSTAIAAGDLEASAMHPNSADTLPANISRVLQALDGGEALQDLGYLPDREQVRIASSGFLLSELPLGEFSRDRYGAPHVNIAHADWPQLLPVAQASPGNVSLAELERSNAVVIQCAADPEPADPSDAMPSRQLWHATGPFDEGMAKANITWLGHHQQAWQFATRSHLHYYFCTPVQASLEATDWHPTLRDAATTAEPVRQFAPYQATVREHWHTGHITYAGEGCWIPNPYLREAALLGIEDAWVLSRMLENYEEDIHDGLVEYEKYRRARTRRVAQTAAQIATQRNASGAFARMLHNLNVALSTRFLPEIAMHRVDWLYSHDCIRGFR